MKEIFIKHANTTIRVDEDNKVLLAFDVIDDIVDSLQDVIPHLQYQ